MELIIITYLICNTSQLIDPQEIRFLFLEQYYMIQGRNIFNSGAKN